MVGLVLALEMWRWRVVGYDGKCEGDRRPAWRQGAAIRGARETKNHRLFGERGAGQADAESPAPARRRWRLRRATTTTTTAKTRACIGMYACSMRAGQLVSESQSRSLSLYRRSL